MVEASANAELVHLSRSMQYQQAADPNLAPPPPRPGLDVFASVLSQEIATAKATAAGDLQTPSDESVQMHTTQPTPEAPPASDATFRQTRLAITVGLVVLLLVVWIIQRRGSTQS